MSFLNAPCAEPDDSPQPCSKVDLRVSHQRLDPDPPLPHPDRGMPGERNIQGAARVIGEARLIG